MLRNKSDDDDFEEEDLREDLKEEFEEEKKSIPVSESKMSFSIKKVPTNNETIPTSKFFKIPPSSPKKASFSNSISNFVRNTVGRHSLKSTIVRKSFKAKNVQQKRSRNYFFKSK